MMKSDTYFDTMLENEQYTVGITIDDSYTVDSTDNRAYDYVMNPTCKRRGDMYKALHIYVTGKNSYSIALVGDYYTYGSNCAILTDHIVTVLQNDHITQIDLDTVQIIKEYELDVLGTTFGIYLIPDGYIIYGEIEVVKLDNTFREVWKFSGKDIFVSVNGKNAFELTENSIKLYDFENNFYELDFDGNAVSE